MQVVAPGAVPRGGGTVAEQVRPRRSPGAASRRRADPVGTPSRTVMSRPIQRAAGTPHLWTRSVGRRRHRRPLGAPGLADLRVSRDGAGPAGASCGGAIQARRARCRPRAPPEGPGVLAKAGPSPGRRRRRRRRDPGRVGPRAGGAGGGGAAAPRLPLPVSGHRSARPGPAAAGAPGASGPGGAGGGGGLGGVGAGPIRRRGHRPRPAAAGAGRPAGPVARRLPPQPGGWPHSRRDRGAAGRFGQDGGAEHRQGTGPLPEPRGARPRRGGVSPGRPLVRLTGEERDP